MKSANLMDPAHAAAVIAGAAAILVMSAGVFTGHELTTRIGGALFGAAFVVNIRNLRRE